VQSRPFSSTWGNRIAGGLKHRAVRAGMGLAVTSGALFYYLNYLKKQRDEHLKKITVPEDYGTPKMGAPFVLTDHNSEAFDSNSRLKDKYALLYFGFTHCPDVCPEELDKMGRIIKELKSKLDIVPIFVTCDPKRDTPAIVKEYLKDFDHEMIGLTVEENGDSEPLHKMAKAFRVYFRPAKTGSEDYLLDHSIFFYLLFDGQFVKVYGRSMSSEQIVRDILDVAKQSDK
jgi:protein SCO1